MLRKVAATLFFLQGAFPLLLCMSGPPAYRVLALLVFVVYGALALEIWIGHRRPLLLAIGITALQFIGISSDLFSWRLLVGPGLLLALAPMGSSVADWKIVYFVLHGIALNYSFGGPCLSLQRDLERDYQMVWVNWVAALICILLLILWKRGRTLPSQPSTNDRI
jgi:hypothetical protein